jgi:enediyne biosynthesis protein E4
MHQKIFFFILSILLFLSCSKDKTSNQNGLFSKLDSSDTGINFVNEVKNGDEMNIFKYRNFYNGGGVAIGDINNDGLSDIYFTSNQGKNKLYLNKGNFKFEDISIKAKVEGNKSLSTGVVMVDINADGLLDIYVCNAGNSLGENQKNELFINNGNLTFTEKADEYNLADTGITTHAAFFDYDKDGDLDCYILNNSFIPVSSLNYSNKRELRDKDWDVNPILKGGGDKLLRNDNGKFTDVSEASGIFGSLIGFGLGVTVGDVNNDLYPDIYISNDFYERDYLYINNKNGTFSEQIQSWATHISQSSMGADMADVNNDGKADIFVTDMLPEGDERLKTTTSFDNYDLFSRKLNLDFFNQYMQNTLQVNNGNNQFQEVANYAGVAKTDWSWGALLFDMDNDGYKDIYVVTEFRMI